MHTAFTMNWWALLLRGIAAILFGTLAFIWPGVTLISLVFVFGAYAIIDGVLLSALGLRLRGWEHSHTHAAPHPG